MKIFIKIIIMVITIYIVLTTMNKLFADEFQLKSIPEEVRHKIKIKCVDTMSNGKYLYYYLPNSHFQLLYVNSKTDNVVRCK